MQLVGLSAALAVVAQEGEVEEQADTVAAAAAGIAAAAAAPVDHSKPHWLLIDKALPPA